MKSDDEIMAEYLLRGGKMLARTCPDCGCPLFEVKGETSCVVCRARRESTPDEEPEPAAAVTEVPRPGRGAVGGDLEHELKATIACLLERIRTEPDPERCRTLIRCVKAAWELLD
ncbi:MAG TPA: Sjogren's syndrome/scleroderma autoantigen 1 family protein [Methanoregulaceae archaeon]|nr:Sjogren's syndrome/scleroderma autoantigen 1 family protein [Methanoregulaceae archaeon]